MQEWLYTDGEDATVTEFQKRLDLLKSIGDPIFFRSTSILSTGLSKMLENLYLDRKLILGS